MTRKISRREFISSSFTAGVALSLGAGIHGVRAPRPYPDLKPVLFIALDAMPSAFLNLNQSGDGPGSHGAWFMSNVRAFVDGGVNFLHTRDYLPAATDMNHLNALAGTSSAQTGVVGVSVQPFNWYADNTINLTKPHISWARDDRGRPVDTLFAAWKRKRPLSTTCFISGKSWIAGMYTAEGSGVDMSVSGASYPSYVKKPRAYPFYDPAEDPNPRRDRESFMQKLFIDKVLNANPEQFPADAWVVDTALAVLFRERPDFGLILLSQMDDVQHALGTAWDPSEFVRCQSQLICDFHSTRNRWIYRDPVLDAVRDVDAQFGRLIAGIRRIDCYRDATLVLYSDHGQINHLLPDDWKPRDIFGKTTDLVDILYRAGELTEEEKDGYGFACIAGCSYGMLCWQGGSLAQRQERARSARDVLMAYETVNPVTLQTECPWDVLTHDEMQVGLPGIAGPGELWHDFFGPNHDSTSMRWPDSIVFMKNGWQIPVFGDVLGNFGIEIPIPLPPFTIFLGGHGAPDTQQIVMAIQGPGIAQGRAIADQGYGKNYRIADLAVTIAAREGLTLLSTTVGNDRSREIAQ
jgi:hypothetical protein